MASHKQLSNWYAQLGQHLEAGVMLAGALRMCEGMPFSGRENMARRIEAEESFEDVLKTAPKWLPQPDRLFLMAAMQTGHLPQTLQNLSDRHAQIGATQMKVILGLLYPLAIFHITALLLPIIQMIDYETGFMWDPIQFITQALTLLIPLWLCLLLLFYLARSQHPILPKILRCFPLLRRYSKKQAAADLSNALGTFINAGVAVPSAWRLAVKITKEPQFHRALRKFEPIFEKGEDPAKSLDSLNCFPHEFRSYYKAGAESGKLDQNMLLAGSHFQKEANLAMTFSSIFYPSLLLVGVASVVIYNIFRVYGDYLKVFDQFTN